MHEKAESVHEVWYEWAWRKVNWKTWEMGKISRSEIYYERID
jgi:hypothetical protein